MIKIIKVTILMGTAISYCQDEEEVKNKKPQVLASAHVH